jgi:hypothetical protein
MIEENEDKIYFSCELEHEENDQNLILPKNNNVFDDYLINQQNNFYETAKIQKKKPSKSLAKIHKKTYNILTESQKREVIKQVKYLFIFFKIKYQNTKNLKAVAIAYGIKPKTLGRWIKSGPERKKGKNNSDFLYIKHFFVINCLFI